MIHERAIIDPSARIASDVTIGPFSIIGPDVEIGEGCEIGPHVVLKGPTKIGRNNKIYQFASIGDDPQDKKYNGEPTLLEMGDGNVIREYCTINRGTVQGGGVTRLGNNNWIMAYVHIAHDCIIANNTILAHAVALAGHVTVEEYAILGAATLVHQFCYIGAHCFTAHSTGITKDVPPYVMVSGKPVKPHGLNSEGLKRREFSAETIKRLKEAYRILYRSNLTSKQAVERLREMGQDVKEVGLLADFVERSERGIVR